MAIQSGEDLFLTILSRVHESEKRLLSAVQELSHMAEDKYVKDMLDVRAFLTQQEVSNIEECFRLMGKQPVPTDTRFHEVWLEDTRRELQEIQLPILKGLYIVTAIHRIQNYHIAQYAALITMSEYAGYDAVTTLLRRNMADKMEFIERTNEFIREVGKRVFVAKAREWYEEKAA
jgi:ferritin-like metal-binding protein YciE